MQHRRCTAADSSEGRCLLLAGQPCPCCALWPAPSNDPEVGVNCFPVMLKLGWGPHYRHYRQLCHRRSAFSFLCIISRQLPLCLAVAFTLMAITCLRGRGKGQRWHRYSVHRESWDRSSNFLPQRMPVPACLPACRPAGLECLSGVDKQCVEVPRFRAGGFGQVAPCMQQPGASQASYRCAPPAGTHPQECTALQAATVKAAVALVSSSLLLRPLRSAASPCRQKSCLLAVLLLLGWVPTIAFPAADVCHGKVRGGALAEQRRAPASSRLQVSLCMS